MLYKSGLKLLALVSLFALTSQTMALGAKKVVILDMKALVGLSDVGQEQAKAIEKSKEFTEAKAKADNLAADLKTMDEKLKSDGLTWGEDKKKEHQKEMNQKLAERQQIVMNVNRMQQMVSEQLFRNLEPVIGNVLKEIVEKEKIDLVLDAQMAVYRGDAVDITEMMVKRLNEVLKAEMAKQKKN